jgi:hypothetical protein
MVVSQLTALVITTLHEPTENTVPLLLRARMLRALPSNDHCLQSHRLATGLYATVLIIYVTLISAGCYPNNYLCSALLTRLFFSE